PCSRGNVYSCGYPSASASQYSGPSQVKVTRVILCPALRVTNHSRYSSCGRKGIPPLDCSWSASVQAARLLPGCFAAMTSGHPFQRITSDAVGGSVELTFAL